MLARVVRESNPAFLPLEQTRRAPSPASVENCSPIPTPCYALIWRRAGSWNRPPKPRQRWNPAGGAYASIKPTCGGCRNVLDADAPLNPFSGRAILVGFLASPAERVEVRSIPSDSADAATHLAAGDVLSLSRQPIHTNRQTGGQHPSRLQIRVPLEPGSRQQG